MSRTKEMEETNLMRRRSNIAKGCVFGIVGAFVVRSSLWWIARLGSSKVCYMIQYFSGVDLFERRDSRWCRHHMMCLICSYIHSTWWKFWRINHFLLVFFVREKIFHLCFTLYPLFNEFICLSRVRINQEKKQTGRYEQSVISLWCC